MKHTPGPWFITEDNLFVYVPKNGAPKTIAVSPSPHEWSKADAKLIAAAPDILKALQGFIHHDDNVKDEYKASPSLRLQIEQAIAKATE